MNDYIIGIDIGSSKICGAVGKIDKNDKLQIIGVTSVFCLGIKKAIVVDIELTSEAISNCVKQLENMVGFGINQAYISIPGGICNLLYNKGTVSIGAEPKKIGDLDVERVLEAAKVISTSNEQEVVGIIPNNYILDGEEQVKEPTGRLATKLEVEAQIITTYIGYVDTLIKSFNKANIKIQGIVLQPVGTSEILLRAEEIEKGIALVNIGADTTTISVFKQGKLCNVEMFLLGGNSITKDISTCLKISISEAERIKVKYGNVNRIIKENEQLIKVENSDGISTDIKLSFLSEITEARVEEILSFIYKTLQKSGYYNEVTGLVLTGGGISFLKGITEISKNIIGKDVKIVTPNYVGAANPLYADCIGIIKHISNKVSIKKSVTDLEIKRSKVDEFQFKQNKKNMGISSKIRKFLGDFF